MSSSASQPELKRVEDLWFPDASLILRAENSLFRVHSSILAARSSVFRDMITFPQPRQPEGGEADMVDGCIVVRLHDSATEVEVFFKAIFDSSFFERAPVPVDFSALIGVLRLSHKYDVQYLFRRALSHLDSMYPTSLQTLQDILTGETYPHVYSSCQWEITEHMGALRAASEVGASWLLPAVYYRITSTFSMELADGRLSIADVQRCLTAQTAFVRATTESHAFLRLLPAPTCRTPMRCRTAVSAAYGMLDEWSSDQEDCNPLSSWVFYCTGLPCDTCTEMAKSSFSAVQERFWARLPSIFGLAEWEELKKMETAIMESAA
ncbi:BTB domain-containing protein [Favolaschia claudopus]|uniref:BTB domain-containing protein n=1 Tax=Favolaschia claudopus TaxID=2862362 RepID=A0AAW0EE31_9AGAR